MGEGEGCYVLSHFLQKSISENNEWIWCDDASKISLFHKEDSGTSERVLINFARKLCNPVLIGNLVNVLHRVERTAKYRKEIGIRGYIVVKAHYSF